MKPHFPETIIPETALQVQIPASTEPALQMLAASSNETIRIQALIAFPSYGENAPAEALVDRRLVR